MLSPFYFAMLSVKHMTLETTTTDVSRHGAQMRDNARKDAPLRDASRQGATMRDDASYTLSVDDVVERLAAAGFPRSKRAVQRFCQMGHLECSRVATELGEKYFVTEESVERRIKELEQLHAISAIPATGGDTVRHEGVAPLRDEARQTTTSHDMTPPVAPLRDEARSNPTETEELILLRKERDTLKDENLNLKIDNRAKEQVITMLNRERRDFISEIKHQAGRIGEMTAKLLQLGAPVDDAHRAPGGDNSQPAPSPEGVEYKVSDTP
jgi:hypothetical protein